MRGVRDHSLQTVERCAPVRLTAGGYAAPAFGTVELCRERHALACQIALELPDTALEQGDLDLCLSDMSCDRAVWMLSFGARECAERPGRRTEGMCIDDLQCSGRCVRDLVPCGQCGPRETTLQHLPDGSACEFDGECGYHNSSCIDGMCVSGLQLEGDACDPYGYQQQPFCSRTLALECGASSVCEAPLISELGERCGRSSLDPGPLRLCRGPAACGSLGDLGIGTCVPHAADEESCGYDRTCMFPARCIDRTCRLPSMSFCP